MADNNPRIQRHLQSIHEEIFELHVVQGKSINECHRVLVHHRDPWFSYSQLVHAVNRWKQMDPLRWNPSSAAAASGSGPPPMSQYPGSLTANSQPPQAPDSNQALADRHVSAPVMTPSSRSVAPHFLSDQMLWLRAGSIGVGQTMAQHPLYPRQPVSNAMLSSRQFLHNLNSPDEDDICQECQGQGCLWCPRR